MSNKQPQSWLKVDTEYKLCVKEARELAKEIDEEIATYDVAYGNAWTVLKLNCLFPEVRLMSQTPAGEEYTCVSVVIKPRRATFMSEREPKETKPASTWYARNCCRIKEAGNRARPLIYDSKYARGTRTYKSRAGLMSKLFDIAKPYEKWEIEFQLAQVKVREEKTNKIARSKRKRDNAKAMYKLLTELAVNYNEVEWTDKQRARWESVVSHVEIKE